MNEYFVSDNEVSFKRALTADHVDSAIFSFFQIATMAYTAHYSCLMQNNANKICFFIYIYFIIRYLS